MDWVPYIFPILIIWIQYFNLLPRFKLEQQDNIGGHDKYWKVVNLSHKFYVSFYDFQS